ncbi:TetR/AcrR family transcriptional regulator [Aliikangiella sp. IMCC44359]|uniref:TetR/AcrR family transcriptional regulator n=1 Tax=Aliikangiella sp. IMCC44359 TaxID=3459125 RepID=UPI00403A99EE
MGRPSNKLQRRAQIVQAMMQVMAEQGYEGASIQVIAQAAGLSSGLIHYHFESKQKILLAAVEELARILELRYLGFCEHATTAELRLKAFINARLALGEGSNDSAVAAWVMIAAEAVRQPEVKEAFLLALKAQQSVLKELLSDYLGCELSESVLDNKVAFVLAFMEGAFSLSISAQELMPKNWAAEELMNTLQSLR